MKKRKRGRGRPPEGKSRHLRLSDLHWRIAKKYGGGGGATNGVRKALDDAAEKMNAAAKP